jgi:hypothetical protein
LLAWYLIQFEVAIEVTFFFWNAGIWLGLHLWGKWGFIAIGALFMVKFGGWIAD